MDCVTFNGIYEVSGFGNGLAEFRLEFTPKPCLYGLCFVHWETEKKAFPKILKAIFFFQDNEESM